MGSNQKRQRRLVKQYLLFVIFVAAVVGGYFLYSHKFYSGKYISASFPKSNVTYHLETATNDAERAKGLMFRKTGDMAENEGMIFIYPKESEHFFWMKNTFISLDMIFVNKDFKIVGILSDVPPQSEQSRTVGKPSQYVIELLAGQAKKSGITAGDMVRFEGDLNKSEEAHESPPAAD